LNKNIWELNYDEIKGLDAGSWFGDKFKGESIPKFSDLIDSIKGKLKLNIELKTSGHEKELADRTVRIVKEKEFVGDCFFTSFNYAQIERVKEIDPSLIVGSIYLFLRLKDIPQSIGLPPIEEYSDTGTEDEKQIGNIETELSFRELIVDNILKTGRSGFLLLRIFSYI